MIKMTEQKNEPVKQDGDVDHGGREEAVKRPPADWNTTVNQPVFVIEDSFFRSRTPPNIHWSIGWSDLMMTMFILFLTLFVYQLAHREFLDKENVEVVAGTEISVPPPQSSSPLPFHPISPQISQSTRPLIAVEKVREIDLENDETKESEAVSERESVTGIVPDLPDPNIGPNEPTIVTRELRVVPGEQPQRETAADEEQAEVNGQTEPEQIITDIFDLSKTALAEEKLEKFAAVELIPDKTMRIILTGDLLFDSGRAELTDDARQSLTRLTSIIAKTPYMINVVGHTDSVPMSSQMFPTNWELSVARASQVARFLIEEIGIPGKQIVVSGFSYFRPVRPNDSEINRRANRRVEIILSKQLPPAVDNPSIQEQ